MSEPNRCLFCVVSMYIWFIVYNAFKIFVIGILVDYYFHPTLVPHNRCCLVDMLTSNRECFCGIISQYLYAMALWVAYAILYASCFNFIGCNRMF